MAVAGTVMASPTELSGRLVEGGVGGRAPALTSESEQRPVARAGRLNAMTKMRFAVGLCIAILGAPVNGQSPGPEPVRFEVASIKPSASDATGGTLAPLPNGVQGTNVPLRILVGWAYDVRSYQIDGGPDWISRERFDVNARAAGATPVDDLRRMLRGLLAERFRLVTHSESKEMPVWALVRSRRDGALGPSLRPCVGDCSKPGGSLNSNLGRLRLTGMPIAQVVSLFPSLVGGPVVDRTGLTGTYDIELEWAPEATPEVASERPTIFTAVQEQLGLRLETSRGPVQMLVIDRAERPTPD